MDTGLVIRAQQGRAGDDQDTQVQKVIKRVAAREDEFRREHPDYDEAYGFLREFRGRAYAGRPQDEVTESLNREELGFVLGIIKEGGDPVVAMYDLSKRYGYVPKAPEVAPVVPGRTEAVEKVRETATSLSLVPGSTGSRSVQDGMVKPEEFWNDTNFSPNDRLAMLQDEEFSDAMLKNQPARIPKRFR